MSEENDKTGEEQQAPESSSNSNSNSNSNSTSGPTPPPSQPSPESQEQQQRHNAYRDNHGHRYQRDRDHGHQENNRQGGSPRPRRSGGGEQRDYNNKNRDNNNRGMNNRSDYRRNEGPGGQNQGQRGRNNNNNHNPVFKSKLGIDEGVHAGGVIPSGNVGTWAGNFLEIEGDLIEKIRREARSKVMEPGYLANMILRDAFAARKKQEGNKKTDDIVNSWPAKSVSCPQCKHEFMVGGKDGRGQHKGHPSENRQNAKSAQNKFNSKVENKKPKNSLVKVITDFFLNLFKSKK